MLILLLIIKFYI